MTCMAQWSNGFQFDILISRLNIKMDGCITNFCGCQQYGGKAVTTKVYLQVGFILFITVLSVRIGSQWFIFKDYYPMKQRSPVLCILTIFIIAINLIIYPLAYTYNYFTRNWGDFKFIYRTVFYGLDGCIYFIYLLRSLRLVYAHQIDTSRSKTWIFKFFKNEYNLVIFLLLVIAVKIIPILATNFDENDYFLTFIDINLFNVSTSGDLGFGIKQIIHQFVWLSIIVYCIYLQTLVHKSYSMKNQLLIVLGIGITFNLSSVILYWTQIGKQSIILQICLMLPEYPLLLLMRDINVIFLFIISIIYPIFKKRVYHMMLPIGRHHDIVKTMRDFLMTNQFIQIFAQFLQYLDNERQTTTCSDTLQCWKKLMVIKYKVANKDANGGSIFGSLKDLIDNMQDKPIKQVNTNLLNTLKQSILSFQDCDEQIESQERFKLIDDISEKIEQLQLIFLQKLDHYYKTEFRQTKSYYYLKMYMLRNKKININMITMGMAVMVQNQDSL